VTIAKTELWNFMMFGLLGGGSWGVGVVEPRYVWSWSGVGVGVFVFVFLGGGDLYQPRNGLRLR